MGELMIRRNRGFAVPRYQGTGKAEKQAAAGQSRTVSRATVTVSETLRQLMTRVSQAESQIRESRRTLQSGEGVLAEVRDSLDRIGELAERAAGGGESDRTALQEELERLVQEIDRMIGSALVGDTPLFLDGEMGGREELDALLRAVLGDGAPGAAEELPDWLLESITRDPPTAEELLEELGLDSTATGAEILAAVMNRPLESNSAAGYLASLYLGAVIAGKGAGADPTQALDGLRQLLEQVAQGVPLDRAIETLTNGEFTSLADFQSQFTGGTIPGLEDFLAEVLLTEGAVVPAEGASVLALLAGVEGMKLELLLGLMNAVQNTGASAPEQGTPADGQPEGLDAAPAQEPGPETQSTGSAARTAVQPEGAARAQVLEFGAVRVMGRDLSQVIFNPDTRVLTIGGTQEVAVQGTGQGEPALVLTGSGKVTLLSVNLSALTVQSPGAQVFSAGTGTLGEVRLADGASLTLDGTGLLKMVALQGGRASRLHLTGGAVILAGQEKENLTLPVVMVEGAASFAAHGVTVVNPEGRAMQPFDLVWKTLLPGWSSILSAELNGHQTKMHLHQNDPARLWLNRGDQGYPIHTLLIRGRDEAGRLRSRYAYLQWNQKSQEFEEVSMYPNPFSVTGGEAGLDWVYEEESHTLHILSAQVTAVSGGTGTAANQTVFSGRIVLADGIGDMELSLDGVTCRVEDGRAFDLGCGNDVTLILGYGTANIFESGAGCAGISLGDGTSLCIDRADPGDSGEPDGSLTAAGAGGGAGIGRDSGRSRDQLSSILIRGGVITAAGTGGGAGIGAGRHCAIGAITILGGDITSSGGSGGAGIGAALGGPAGDISIRGGRVTAAAASHAAAIGAGVQGECGSILITGTARIVKALGGDPGADIGACLFGGCGDVQISGGADIGGAGLRRQSGIALRMGEDTVTLPQFRLSVRTLGLDQLNLTTPEEAKEAGAAIEADRKWLSQIQEAYSALYHRMERSVRRIRGAQQYMDASERLVRDNGSASSLLEGILHQPAQAVGTHRRPGKEDLRQLFQ